MLRVNPVFFLLTMLASFCLGQEGEAVTYDVASGNYIIRYKGTLSYARQQDGRLRKLTRDDSLYSGEEYVEIDSIFTVVWEPPTKIDPIVYCSVSRFSETERKYFFRLVNGTTSRQRLLSFVLEYGQGVKPISQTENRWFNRQMYEPGAEGLANKWGWLAAGEGVSPIEAGDSLGGFALIASGLPGIGIAYLDGERSQIIEFPGGGPTGEIGKKVSQLKIFPMAYVARSTVIPVLPASPFIPVVFLDTLISYKHQAQSLGWINNQGIAKSLDQKLDNAKKQLEKKDNKAAKNILEAFVKEVEAQKDKHLSSEAYALLKFNAEYLISKLMQ